MKLGSCKSAINPPVIYTTDRSKVVVPEVYSTRRFVLSFVLFCSCVFQSFEHCDYLAWGRES